MSGYNHNKWRRGERDSGSQRSRGGQNPNFWNDNHFNNYPDYRNQFIYPQETYSQQWDPWNANNQNQYGTSFSRERETSSTSSSHSSSRYSFGSSQSHGKTTVHSSSHRSQSPSSESRSRHSYEKRSSFHKNQSPSAESRNRYCYHSHEKPLSSSFSKSRHSKKAPSPPLGSEEARKKTLAQATDKIKSCLRSFRNEKSEVLENLLSNVVEKKKDESLKSKSVRMQKSGCTEELKLTSSDLKGIGMVCISGTMASTDGGEIANSEFHLKEFSESLNRGGKTDSLIKNKEHPAPIKPVKEPIISFEDGINQESKRSLSLAQSSSVNVSCPRSRSASSSGISSDVYNKNEASDSKQAKHSTQSNQNQQKCTVKDLKQRIIQQFLTMSKNNLKDLINNPRSRKFEFAMNHLMKEHRILLSRELRGLAQSRIRGQDVEIQDQNEKEFETQSLLDTDVAINLSHLPQEVIEKLGNFLQLNLLDSAESADFHPNIPVEDESSVHDIQNIEALQVALLSEENIKREIEDMEVKQELEENINNIDVKNRIEADIVINQQDTEQSLEIQGPMTDTESKNNDAVDTADVEEREVVYEEGGAAKRSKPVTYKFSPYIPLGKGFMNRTGEFGNLFCEFPDFLGMESSEPEGEAMDEQGGSVVDVAHAKNTDKHSSYMCPEILGEGLEQQNITSETGFIDPSSPDGLDTPCYTAILPNEILNDEMTKNTDMIPCKPVIEKSTSETGVENSTLEDAIVESVTGSYNKENQIENSYDEKNKSENMLHVTADTIIESQTSDEGRSNPSVSLKGDSMNEAIEQLEQACATVANDVDLTGNEDRTISFPDKNFVVTESKIQEPEIKQSEFLEENVEATDTADKPENIEINYNNNAVMLNESVETEFAKNNSDSKVNAGDENCKYKLKVDVDSSENKEENKQPEVFEKENKNKVADSGNTLNDIEIENRNTEASINGSTITNTDDRNNIVIQEDCDESELNSAQGNPNDGLAKENEIHGFRDNETEDISVEDLYGDLSDYCNAGEVHNSTVNKVQTENCANEMAATVGVLDSEIAKSVDTPSPIRNFPKEGAKTTNEIDMQMEVPPPEDTDMQVEVRPEDRDMQMEVPPSENTDMQIEVSPAEVADMQMEVLAADTQIELPHTDGVNNPICQDEISELYRCNVVIKAEKEDSSEYGVVHEEMHQTGSNVAIGRVIDETQIVCRNTQLSETNLDPSLKLVDIATQTKPPDELDSNDIQRLLQLLEKSSQLSPQLAKLLKDHFSSSRVTDYTGSSKVSCIQPIEKSSTLPVLREKSPPFLVQPVGSTVSPRAFVHVPENHDLDVSLGPATSAQENSFIEGMESEFRSSLLTRNKGKKNYLKRGRISKPGIQESVSEPGGNHKVDFINKEIEGSSIVETSVNNSEAVNEGVGPSNATRDVRDAPSGPHTRYVFLKMLEIDKEIQRLMEAKLELYKKLQLSLEADSPCANRAGNVSPKTRVLHYSSPSTSKEVSSTIASAQNLNGRTLLQNNSNTQQLHMSFQTVNSHDIIGSSFAGDKTASASTPMVMLPMDFVLSTSSEHSSLQRHKVNERLKTFDTSVVEAVLNSFNIPDSHAKGDESVATELVNNSMQNKYAAEDNPNAELEDRNSPNKNKIQTSSNPNKESHQSERSSAPKKQSQKSKSEPIKEQQTPDRKKLTQVGIATRNKSSLPTTTQTKNQTDTSSETSVRRSVRSDSSKTPTKEQKNMKQIDTNDNKENAADKTTRSTRQKHAKGEEESTQPDSSVTEDKNNRSNRHKQASMKSSEEILHHENNNEVEEKKLRSTRQKQSSTKSEEPISNYESGIVEDKKDKRSSTKSKLKNDKQLEVENSSASSRPKRNSQSKSDLSKSSDQILSQASNSTTRNRRETRTRPSKEVEQTEDLLEQASNKKGTRLSKKQTSTNYDGTDISADSLNKLTQKRKISNKTETCDSDQVDTSSYEEQAQVRGRRNSGRTSSERQDSQSITHENTESFSRKKKKLSKVDDDIQAHGEVQESVEKNTVPSKKHTKTVTPPSIGQTQNNENCKVSDQIPNIPIEQPPAKSKRHINGAQKRKLEEAEEPPAKIHRPNPKPDLLQWNLQDCFVMVKPLAIEHIDESQQQENSIKKEIVTGKEQFQVRRSSSSSDDVPVAETVKKGKRKGKKQDLDGCHRIDLPDTSDEILDPLDSSDNQQDPLGGIPDTPQPPELHVETYGNVNSSPMQVPPDLLMQSNSPGQMLGQCLLPEIAIQDENSISTLVSDTISVMSDGEQPCSRRIRNDDKNETDLISESADIRDDCDRDSSYSYDTAQEGREGTSSRSSKHKSSRKHKKDRKTEGIERLTFEAHEGPILDIKTVGRHVLAASEDGNVYCYSLKSGKFKRKYEGHNAAVTCLSVIECSNSSYISSDNEGTDGEQVAPDLFFTGSLDKHLRHFSFKTGELVQKPIDIGSPIQCMDQNWGNLYIGTKIGDMVRYNIKTSSLIGEPIKIGKDAVLTLKATKEGPRQVLIIGTRNKPIAVRDASTGLLLRTMNNNWSNTVYSLVLTTSVVYCGTNSGIIPAVEFTSGEEICRFQAGTSGVVCMRIYNNLLFAGCYDGNIYVFSIQDKKQVSCIPGPGKMLLCMDIVKNRIIAGSKDSNKLQAWGFPQEIRNHLKEAKHR